MYRRRFLFVCEFVHIASVELFTVHLSKQIEKLLFVKAKISEKQGQTFLNEGNRGIVSITLLELKKTIDYYEFVCTYFVVLSTAYHAK
jgi:hypothetical protein